MSPLFSRIVFIVLFCGIHVCAQAAEESGTMDLPIAKQFVDSLISAVETKGMKPIDPARYQFAKSRLFQVIERESSAVDRKELYGASREMLGTLNAGGHTFLWSREKMASWQTVPAQQSSSASPVVRAIRTESGTVLLIRPAPVLATDIASTREYAAELNSQIEAEVSKSSPCAVAVDLTDQTGGNAWPVLAALGALVTNNNSSIRIDRSNEARPLFRPMFYTSLLKQVGLDSGSALTRFSGGAVAIVINGNTASAGEMLAIILGSEPNRSTFGAPSFGLTTSNEVLSLPDGASLILTTERFAYMESKPVAGKVLPDKYFEPGVDLERVRTEAAVWASQASRQCRAH